MAESFQHKNLVRKIVSYLDTIINICPDLIEADLDDYNTRTTRVVGGYYPDVFYRDTEKIIIGEAKTENDLLTPHTEKQISSYISEVLLFPGHKHIIISVPFIVADTLYNYINSKYDDDTNRGITFHLINDLNRNDKLWL